MSNVAFVRLFIRIFPLLFIAEVCISCVVPPPAVESRVLPAAELALISTIKRGKDYALAGRYDFAEEEFQRALIMAPNLDTLLNDLGFVIMEQGRSRESIAYFQKALTLMPGNLITATNLARAHYRSGDLELAAKEFHDVIEKTSALSQGRIPLGNNVPTPGDLVIIYRDFVTTLYILGIVDEAVCYSTQAYNLASDITAKEPHIRLLLSLGRIGPAFVLLQSLVSRTDAGLPVLPQILADYAVVLYSRKDYALADEAANRAFANAGVGENLVMESKFLKVLVAMKEQKQEDFELLSKSFLEEYPIACNPGVTITPDYWPDPLQEDAELLIKDICAKSIPLRI